MSAPAVQSFYEQIAANRRRSILLVLIITALLAVFGFVIGFALTGYWQGGVAAIGVAVVLAAFLSALSYFAGDSIVLATSGAEEVSEQTAPQLMNVVREMAIAGNVPMPRVHLINDRRRTRLRPAGIHSTQASP